jgi:hypothetical protein
VRENLDIQISLCALDQMGKERGRERTGGVRTHLAGLNSHACFHALLPILHNRKLERPHA